MPSLPPAIVPTPPLFSTGTTHEVRAGQGRADMTEFQNICTKQKRCTHFGTKKKNWQGLQKVNEDVFKIIVFAPKYALSIPFSVNCLNHPLISEHWQGCGCGRFLSHSFLVGPRFLLHSPPTLKSLWGKG